MVLGVVFGLLCARAQGLVMEYSTSHTHPIDPLGLGGTVTNPDAATDADWGSYCQATSNGDGIQAIVWQLAEVWNIPTGASDLGFRWKIETPGIWQYNITVFFLNPQTQNWDQIRGHWNGPGGQNEFSGVLDETIPIPAMYVDANGVFESKSCLFNKWNGASWSRLYETRIEYIPEPCSLAFLLLGAVGMLRQRSR